MYVYNVCMISVLSVVSVYEPCNALAQSCLGCMVKINLLVKEYSFFYLNMYKNKEDGRCCAHNNGISFNNINHRFFIKYVYKIVITGNNILALKSKITVIK